MRRTCPFLQHLPHLHLLLKLFQALEQVILVAPVAPVTGAFELAGAGAAPGAAGGAAAGAAAAAVLQQVLAG